MAETWTPIDDPTAFQDDAVFEIDEKTKSIQVLIEQPIVAGENKSQFIKFQMGRYYDAIDLTGMEVNILYESPTGYQDISTAVNREYSDEYIRFGWLVPYAACPVKGTLGFAVEFVGADYVLKTTRGETPVLDSISGSSSVPEPTEQTWYIELQSQVAAAINNANSTLESVREYIDTFQGNIDDAIDNWFDAHPEATTTVQDGSITREKFTESLNKKIDSIYNTVQDMVQDVSLSSGMFVQTGGHGSVYDGGGQLYRITSVEPHAQSSAEVPAEVYETLTNGLYAERVLGFKETKFSISDKLGNSYSGNFVNNSSVITELLNVCSSYEDNGDKLYYGHYSALDYGDHDVSNGENDGKYQIDCSAFVQLALAGISFDSSRYNVNDNYFVSQYSFFPYRIKAEYQNQDTWAKYRLSDCQAKYAYENGYSFLPNWDWSNVQAGDVVYLQDGDIESSNWGGVDHVMIYIGRRGGSDDLVFYECGGNSRNRSSVSSSNVVHVRTSTLAFMNANTKLIARYPLGVGGNNANCVIYENKHPDYPATYSAGSQSANYEIEPISKDEWYTVICKVKSLNSYPFFVTDGGHVMAYPAIDSDAIFVNTFRATNDFNTFRIGSYSQSDSDIVFEDFKIVKGFGNSLNVPYHKPTQVKKVETITANYKNTTANAWEYVGLSITVPTGHRYLVRCTQGWNSGKPIGMALHTATSGMLTYTHESANDAVMGTPMYMLDSGTWYLFTKRATVATAANIYAVTILDVDLN